MERSAETKIFLQAKFLNSQLEKHIYDKICQLYLNRCDQEYGYILQILNKIELLENVVSSGGNGCFFTVKFSIKSLKPEIGNCLTGKICMIFVHGIFVEVAGKMKVLVPFDKMNGYKYSKNRTTFHNGKKFFSEGDKVEIVLELIKYEKQNFSCIARLKNS
jgi:DNA-directed RNA polymerase subunit E'/Rpb7